MLCTGTLRDLVLMPWGSAYSALFAVFSLEVGELGALSVRHWFRRYSLFGPTARSVLQENSRAAGSSIKSEQPSSALGYIP